MSPCETGVTSAGKGALGARARSPLGGDGKRGLLEAFEGALLGGGSSGATGAAPAPAQAVASKAGQASNAGQQAAASFTQPLLRLRSGGSVEAPLSGAGVRGATGCTSETRSIEGCELRYEPGTGVCLGA